MLRLEVKERLSHLAANSQAGLRVARAQLLRARGVTDPQGHLHPARSCPCRTFCRLQVCRREAAHGRQMGLALGSRCLKAEQEPSRSSDQQGVIGVRRLPPALAAVEHEGWKILVRRRKGGGGVGGRSCRR